MCHMPNKHRLHKIKQHMPSLFSTNILQQYFEILSDMPNRHKIQHNLKHLHKHHNSGTHILPKGPTILRSLHKNLLSLPIEPNIRFTNSHMQASQLHLNLPPRPPHLQRNNPCVCCLSKNINI